MQVLEYGYVGKTPLLDLKSKKIMREIIELIFIELLFSH